jgi:hypothetical protein
MMAKPFQNSKRQQLCFNRFTLFRIFIMVGMEFVSTLLLQGILGGMQTNPKTFLILFFVVEIVSGFNSWCNVTFLEDTGKKSLYLFAAV